MKKKSILSIFLLPFLGLTNIPSSNSVEINCESAAWRNQDYCLDKVIVKKKKKKVKKFITEITYPVNIETIAFLDLSTGKALPANLNSNNGDKILIQIREEEDQSEGKSSAPQDIAETNNQDSISLAGKLLTIESDSILEWSVGDYSKMEFSGLKFITGTAGSLTGTLAGTLAFGVTPATPFLVLLAPVMGSFSANRYVPDWRIAIRKLEKDGTEQLVLIQAVNEQDALFVRSLVAKSSGLKAGQRRISNPAAQSN